MFTPLKPGDKVAIVSPSRGGPGIFPHIYEPALETLKDLGLEVIEMPHVRAENNFIFDHPRERAQDINAAFADPSIKMIISSIGGDDSVRILPFLDEKIIKKNPKVLMGFSDTTAVLTYLYKLGNPCYYGPSMMAGLAQYQELGKEYQQHIKHFFFSDLSGYRYQPYKEITTGFLDRSKAENAGKIKPMNKVNGWNCIQGSGIVEGKLFGGCYEVLGMVNGTKRWLYDKERDDTILFVEISGDHKPKPGNISEYLRNWAAQGIFDRVKGLLRGRPGTYDQEESNEIDKLLKKFFTDELKKPDFPVLSQMDFGHYYPQHIMPMGHIAKIDCEHKTLTLI